MKEAGEETRDTTYQRKSWAKMSSCEESTLVKPELSHRRKSRWVNIYTSVSLFLLPYLLITYWCDSNIRDWRCRLQANCSSVASPRLEFYNEPHLSKLELEQRLGSFMRVRTGRNKNPDTGGYMTIDQAKVKWFRDNWWVSRHATVTYSLLNLPVNWREHLFHDPLMSIFSHLSISHSFSSFLCG